LQLLFNLFPGGRDKALTMSYDDGQIFDIRLAEIFNKNGIKGTFHLNSGTLNTDGFITSGDVKKYLCGHEISVHTKTHPYLERIPVSLVASEIMEDKTALEALAGYPIRGMSYPFGTYSPQVVEHLRCLGMEYSRTTQATNKFMLPKDFLEWHPSAHHKMNISGLLKDFLAPKPFERYLRVMYIWGHSYEFDRENNWELIEDFCKEAGGRNDIWYATNIEIMDYANAVKNLKISADSSMLQNNSIVDVWLTIDGEPRCIKSGELLCL